MEVNFSNHTVLVTGGTGFIGSHLIEKLLSQKNRVITTYQSVDRRSYFYQKQLHASTIQLHGNIKDFSFISHIISKYHVAYIVHLGAQALVEAAYDNPKETLETNINGTVSVLESARLYPFVKAVIIASSDKAYGKLRKGKYKETDALRGDHPYDVSKTAADLIGTTYWKTYKTPVILTRFSNIYGEGDLNFSRIIPDIMHSVLANTPLLVRSNGSYVREYLYVKDVVNGYLTLLKKANDLAGEAFNFGSPYRYSVLELIKLCGNVLHKKIEYKILNTAKNEIPYQSLDYRKARTRLRWKPLHTLEKTIPSIFSYYKDIYEMQML